MLEYDTPQSSKNATSISSSSASLFFSFVSGRTAILAILLSKSSICPFTLSIVRVAANSPTLSEKTSS